MSVNEIGFVLLLLAVFCFSLFSGKLRNSIVTVPIVFILIGLALSPAGLDVLHLEAGHTLLDLVFEVTLVLILFSDASRIDLKALIKDHNLPLRLLGGGMPLTILFGTLGATLLFDVLSIWEAALLAAILTPTDAALGQSVVSDPVVPARIRQTLNVESGLNDGIALPVVLILASIAGTGGEGSDRTIADWLLFGGGQIILGPLVGGIAGYIGAKLIENSTSKGWITAEFEGIGILGVAALSFLAAELLGGNGFISAFTAGLLFGNTVTGKCEFLFEFMETEGQLLAIATFFLFGLTMLPDGLSALNCTILLYAILSLTVIRMIPVAMVLLGSGINAPTYFFLGWFGPRGIASILFALLIVEEAAIPHGDTILATTVVTVALSALLHGISAAPLAKLYGQRVEAMGECEEMKPVLEMPLRHGNQ